MMVAHYSKILVSFYTKDLCHSPPLPFQTEKDASHISMTHAFLYTYFINLYFLCLLLSVDNKISSEFQSLLETVLLMEDRFYNNCSCPCNIEYFAISSSVSEHKIIPNVGLSSCCRSKRNACRRIQRYGYMGKRKCSFFRII